MMREHRMKKDNLEVIRWLKQAKKGNKQAFSKLFNHFRKDVLNFCYALTRRTSLAEELTQETFTKAFLRLDQLQELDKFKSWLFIIARNKYFDYLKPIKNQQLEPLYNQEMIEDQSNNDHDKKRKSNKEYKQILNEY